MRSPGGASARRCACRSRRAAPTRTGSISGPSRPGKSRRPSPRRSRRRQRRAQLTWLGGSFLGTDIAGFRVYSGATPGGAVDYSSAVTDITAYPAGILTDGYGLGGYGAGGFGQVAGTYSWLSDPLVSGTWNFAVAPYDAAGNVGTAATTAQSIAVPPLEPGLFSDGVRLHYSYAQPAREVTLTWLASTG